MGSPTIMISHVKRASANSDQGKSLMGVNTPLTAEAGLIKIRVVPRARDQWRGLQLQSKHQDKSGKTFQLCVIRLATRNCFISFLMSSVLFGTGSPSRKYRARLHRRLSSCTRRYRLLRGGWCLAVVAWSLVPGGISGRTSETTSLLNSLAARIWDGRKLRSNLCTIYCSFITEILELGGKLNGPLIAI